MEVRRSFRVFLGLLLTPLLFTGPVQALDKNTEMNTRLLAGAIGKSSSATARVTLVIPARPKTPSQASTKTVNKNQRIKQSKKPGNSNPQK